MLTLYGVYRSRASRPLWLLAELGLPFNLIPVIQSDRLADPLATDAPLNTASAAFLSINPFGQVPVLVEDELTLSESFAITLHIARLYGGTLGPQSDAETALMEQWAFFAATSIESPARAILSTVESGGAETAEGQSHIARSAAILHRPLTNLNGFLGTHPYLVGDRFTVADVNLAECLRYAQEHPAVLAPFPSVQEWIGRCQSRPAFKEMLKGQQAEAD
jgi:glutathione S-transferase